MPELKWVDLPPLNSGPTTSANAVPSIAHLFMDDSVPKDAWKSQIANASPTSSSATSSGETTSSSAR